MKRSIILMAAVLAAGCADLPLFSPSLERLEGEPVQVVRLQDYFPRHYSGFDEQARLVVQSRAEWELAWKRMWRSHGEVPPAPAVDFESEVVLVAAMGTRGSGGHHVEVQAAAVQSDRVAVRVVETSPGSGCVVTMAITTPVDVVKLPRTPLPVEFQTVKDVDHCD